MWSKIKRLSTRLQDTQWMWTMSSLCPLVTQAFSWNKEKSFILKVNFWSHSVACCLAALGRVNASTGWATAALSTGGNIAFTTWAHMINRMNMTIVQICHIMCLFFPPTGVIWWSQKQNEVSPLRKSTCLIYSEMIIQEKQNYIVISVIHSGTKTRLHTESCRSINESLYRHVTIWVQCLNLI